MASGEEFRSMPSSDSVRSRKKSPSTQPTVELTRSVPHSRDQGDGAYMPVPAPTEQSDGDQPQKKPFSISMELDLMQVTLTLVALASRFWRLEYPRAIVFDELNNGRFIQMYCKRQFFFDLHPPLGKMMISGVAALAGFDLDFNFDVVGSGYLPTVPVWYLRFIPALFGSLLVPLTYQLMVEMKFSRWTAALAAFLVIGENALLTQSRFMLVDAILLFFMASAMLCVLKFRKANKSAAFSWSWWAWLTLLGISMTFAVSTKYVGIYTAYLALGLVAWEFWKMLMDYTLSNFYLWKQCLAYFLLLVLLPVAIYLAIFYTHLRVLYKAGPHDDVMTSGFQASLEGGLASITKGQPLEVVFGSQVTLRNTYSTSGCWLHSHDHLYPLRYQDKRGSSHQQQVTCYSFKDSNNWWFIKDPAASEIKVNDTLRPIKHGDMVQIMHGITSRLLNSHDVGAPLSPNNQEVSCYIDYNISMKAQDLWRVEIVNRESEGDTWLKIRSYVKFVHVSSKQYLTMSGKQLPDWGFHQFEVMTDRVASRDSSVWNVEEHKYFKKEEEGEAGSLRESEMLPLEPTDLSFWNKFKELQYKMITNRRDARLEHRFSSQPAEWPLLDKNIGYWVNAKDHSQIHLIGNPVMWYSATGAVLLYAALLTFYLMRQRRLHYDLSPSMWEKFTDTGLLFFAGYLLHYLPFFAIDRTMFLYHYLPALYFKLLLLAAMVEHVYSIINSPLFRLTWMRHILTGVLVAWLVMMTDVFVAFSTLSYGSTLLKAEDLGMFMWKESWDFIVHGR